MLSVNRNADKLVKQLCDDAEEYGVTVSKMKSGATLIDAGVQASGGFSAGKIITEICMGGLGNVEVLTKQYGDLELPTIFVSTDHPTLATLGSQYAGWQITSGDFFAIGSGPARALALKPKDIYEKIRYKDKADTATVVLETGKKPPEQLATQFASECKIKPNKLYIILTPTASVAGSVQVSGRIVETGIHKLMKLGLDPTVISYAWGCAPIAPVHPKFAHAMGRTNDVILYGGFAYYALRYEDDKKLEQLVNKAPSKVSKQYGKPFMEIFKEANSDFYKIDPHLFAPAALVINNWETGRVFKAGEIDVDVLKRSIGLKA